MHTISYELEFRPDRTTDHGVITNSAFPLTLNGENGVKILPPGVCFPLPRGYIHVLNHKKENNV